MKNVKGLFTGETDKNGVNIYYETSILKFPDGTIGKLLFDQGQLSAYYAREDNSWITKWDGVNNVNSIYLSDCEVIHTLDNESKKKTLHKDIIIPNSKRKIMKQMNEWIPYSDLELNDPENNVFSIDTRDFHAGYRFEEKSHKDFDTLKKYPDFFHTEQEVKNLLDRYYTESGGEGEWRMFSLESMSDGWNMKYIRIWRTELGFIVCDSDNRAYRKEILDVSVNQKYLNKC